MEEFGKGQTEGRNVWMWVIERVDFILISKKFLKDLSGKKTISYCFINRKSKLDLFLFPLLNYPFPLRLGQGKEPIRGW